LAVALNNLRFVAGEVADRGVDLCKGYFHACVALLCRPKRAFSIAN
jgi:hypothetical protein